MAKPKQKPKTKGGMTIKHVQASTNYCRKVPITLPKISLEKGK
jgi:hypothetical protein